MTTERGSVPCGRIAVLVRVRWKNINIFLFTLSNPKKIVKSKITKINSKFFLKKKSRQSENYIFYPVGQLVIMVEQLEELLSKV